MSAKHKKYDKYLRNVILKRMKKETKRSKSAEICERIARRILIPKGKTLTEVMMEYRKAKGKKKYDLPIFVKMSEKVDDVMAKDMQLFYMNVENNDSPLIIYLHGGAYVEEMLPFHWLMLDKITKSVDATFIIPDYPLAPFSDYRECFDKMTRFYKKVLKYYKGREIIMMGDSAGGGLSLALSMYFAKKDLPVPEKLILLSPWVDLNMDNPEIEKYIRKDPMLKLDELKIDARYWANGTDLNDYRLSPIFGDLSVLKNVTLFTGTHEFFYPDIVKLKKLLDKNKIRNKLFVGEGLNHVYPAFPIPEADEAIEQISEIINA